MSFAYGDGIDRFSRGEWWSSYGGEEVPISVAYGVSTAPDGAVWVAGYEAFRFDGEDWTSYSTEEGVVASPLMYVQAAGDGSVWFVSDRSGLTRWVPSQLPLACQRGSYTRCVAAETRKPSLPTGRRALHHRWCGHGQSALAPSIRRVELRPMPR